MTVGYCQLCDGPLRHLVSSGQMQCAICGTWWQRLDGVLYVKELGARNPRWLAWPEVGKKQELVKGKIVNGH